MKLILASREICKICYHVNRIGFTVSNDIWVDVVPPGYKEDVVCLECFTRLADEKFVEWDKDIKFYPVSLVTHIGASQR